MTTNTKIVKGRVIGNALKKPTDPVAIDDIPNKGYVDKQIDNKKSSYPVRFGVYDQGGTPTATGGDAVSIGDNVIAFDSVGSFVINVIYRCTSAGSASTATFTPIPLSEGLGIIVTDFITDPNDNTKYFEADIIYIYDADNAKWTENGQRQSAGDVHGIYADIAFNSGTVVFSLPLPLNAEIQSLEIIFKTAFDSTGALLTIGEISDQDKILQSADINLHDYVSGDYEKVIPKDQVSGGLIAFTNRTPINAYFTPATGASAGSIQLRINYLVK
jgi:hypothetical protein